MRRIVPILCLLMVAGLLPVAQAQEGPPEVPDLIRGFIVMPPGQSGTVTAADFASGEFGPHFDDQLEMYASLVLDDDVTEEELPTYFRTMQFSPGEEVESSYSPVDGVTVHRDSFGVPHIYANSVNSASFAAGYVTAEDRLFQMDIFRHAARGELAGFAGPGANDSLLQADIDTRREGYTEEEIQKLFDDLDDKFGETGVSLQEGLQAYSDGVNARIDEVMFDPEARPFEYEGTGNFPPGSPEPWSPLDTLFIAVLQLRVFGETAGGELRNAGFYAYLTSKLGTEKGRKLYDELLFQNDSRSATSVARKDANFHTQDPGRVNWNSVAIPGQRGRRCRATCQEGSQSRGDPVAARAPDPCL